MKEKMKLIVFLLLITIKIQAQTAIPAGTFTVNGKTFNANVDTHTFNSDGRRMSPNTMHITLVGGEETNPVYVNLAIAAGQTASRECLLSVFEYDIDNSKPDFINFFNIVRSVFPASRVIDIMNYDSKGIKSISFYIDPSGVVKDMTITITENTLITPQEIELLYTRMLAQMSFATSPTGCPSAMRFFKTASITHIHSTMREIYTNPYYFGNGPRWAGR